MLGRSANGIFWMARYLERAENTARLLDAGFRMALTRGASAARDEWRSVLTTIGQDSDYAAHGGDYSGQSVVNYVLRAPENQGSVFSMIEQARTNARAVRTAVQSCGKHPAIFAFSVANEIPADVVRWHGARRVERFLAELADALAQGLAHGRRDGGARRPGRNG